MTIYCSHASEAARPSRVPVGHWTLLELDALDGVLVTGTARFFHVQKSYLAASTDLHHCHGLRAYSLGRGAATSLGGAKRGRCVARKASSRRETASGRSCLGWG